MIPTKTLITLLRAMPFDEAAFHACLKSKEGERLIEGEMVALGYQECGLAEQDCLPFYEALAQYQTNLKDEKYKQAFYRLLECYASSSHPYTKAMVLEALRGFDVLVKAFPKMIIYQTVFMEIKQQCYVLCVLDDESQVNLKFQPIVHALEKPFEPERHHIFSTFASNDRYQALQCDPDAIQRMKYFIENLMVGEDGGCTLFNVMVSTEFFPKDTRFLYYGNMRSFEDFILNLAGFIQEHQINIRWGCDFTRSLVDFLLLVLRNTTLERVSLLLQSYKTLQVNLEAEGCVHNFASGREVKSDVWVLMVRVSDPSASAWLAVLMEHIPQGINQLHRFGGDREPIHVLVYLMECAYISSMWPLGEKILNVPSLQLTPEVCDAVFKAQLSESFLLANCYKYAYGDGVGFFQLMAMHPVFRQQPGFVEWVFSFGKAKEFPLYILTNLNESLNLALSSHLQYILAFSLRGSVYCYDADERKSFEVKYGVTYEVAFAYWMMNREYSMPLSCIEPNFAEWVGPRVLTGRWTSAGEEEYLQNFRYIARTHFKERFKCEPDRHSLKQAYLEFLSRSPALKSALLEALILKRPCLFLNVLMSHKHGNDLKPTKDYEQAIVLVRGAAVSDALITHLKTVVEGSVPSPYEAVLYLGLSRRDMIDIEMKKIMLTHLLSDQFSLKEINPVRDALKLLSDAKYTWLMKCVYRLTIKLIQSGDIQKSQLNIFDKKQASPLTLILRSGQTTRNDKDTHYYKEVMGAAVSSRVRPASTLFRENQSSVSNETELADYQPRSRRFNASSSETE